jgi:L-ribulokinase
MGSVNRAAYRPDEANAKVYDRLYAEYLALHDHFGRGGTDVMRRLRALRREVLSVAPPAPRAPEGTVSAETGASTEVGV